MNQGDFWMKNCDLAARNEDDSENRLSIYIYIYDQFNWGPKPGIRPGNDRWLIGYLLGCTNLFDGGYGGMSFWDFALNQSVEGTWWIPWFLVQGLVSSLQNFRCFSLPTGFGDFQRGFHDPCSDTPWLPQMSSLGVARKLAAESDGYSMLIPDFC